MPNMTNKAALKQKIMTIMNPANATMPATTVSPEAMSQQAVEPQRPTSGFMVTDDQDTRPVAEYKFGKYVDWNTGQEIDPSSKEYRYRGRAVGEYFDAPPIPVTSGKYSKKK